MTTKIMQFFRLVNMLDIVELDDENVWKIIKETRKSFLFEHTHIDCEGINNNILLDINYIKQNIHNLEEELKLNITSTPAKHVSAETLETAAKMFIYLNNCPPKYLSLISNILKSEKPKDIILALSSIMVTTKNFQKIVTAKVFSKTMETLKLKHFEVVQINTKRKCYNKKGIFDNCTSQIDDSETLRILGFS